MKGLHLPVSAVIAAVIAVVPLPAAAQEATDDLTLRRVMLSTGGVGYFEYEATVDGDADLPLPVLLDQVNDVLKSIVVYDDTGGIGEISLPGREPLREVFREMPFDPAALDSPIDLLNALRGSEVRVSGAREISGRIIAVTPEQTALPGNGGTVTQHRVSLLTVSGIRQLILEETDQLEFVDPALSQQIDTALAALSQHNERDRRTVTVRTTGTGERTVRVAYVVEVPLWKTSYRLTLSDDQAVEEAAIQGWAILENLSGEDWEDIELTVVSGNPVTFQQALYDAYYVDRPEVPVEVFGRVLPGVDTGARPGDRRDQLPPPAPPAQAALAGALMAPEAEAAYDRGFYDSVDDGDDRTRFAQVTAADSTEATSQVMFRFPDTVSVTSGHSLLVPMIAREVPVQRLSLYQPETHTLHPLSAVRLTNDGETGLPPGVLTLYERSTADGSVAFVGDARLGAFPGGEERLVSFAVDQRVRVERENQGGQTITEGSIVDGVLSLTLMDSQTTTYTITGAAREDRLVAIEHPKQAGWDLIVDEALTVEETAERYRVFRTVEAGAVAEVEVTLQRPRSERLELINLSDGQVRFYAAARELSEPMRRAISDILRYRAAIADAETAVRELEREQRDIIDDQGRVRRNLDTVPRDSDLYQRYLQTLSQQEDRLEDLRGALGSATEAVASARQALVSYARGLTL